MIRKLTASILLASALTALTPFIAVQAATRPEVAESVKAWEGNEGLQVWTLRYGSRNEHKALVQITDIDHDWNKKIQLMDVEEKGERRDYSVQLDGKKFVVLVLNKYNRGEVYLPGESTAHNIYYSNALSAEGNAQYFLTDYLEQQEKSTD